VRGVERARLRPGDRPRQPPIDRFVSAKVGAPVSNPLASSLLVAGGSRGSADNINLRPVGAAEAFVWGLP
jgi:hypothetical protein